MLEELFHSGLLYKGDMDLSGFLTTALLDTGRFLAAEREPDRFLNRRSGLDCTIFLLSGEEDFIGNLGASRTGVCSGVGSRFLSGNGGS